MRRFFDALRLLRMTNGGLQCFSFDRSVIQPARRGHASALQNFSRITKTAPFRVRFLAYYSGLALILAYRLGNFAGVGATFRRTMTMWLVPSMGNSCTASSFRPSCLMAFLHSESQSGGPGGQKPDRASEPEQLDRCQQGRRRQAPGCHSCLFPDSSDHQCR